jgi:hypothetical protein
VEALGPSGRREVTHDTALRGYLSADPEVPGTLRTIAWGPLMLFFLDRSGEVARDELPFVAWALGWSEGDRRFTTSEGVGLGSRLSDLRAAYGRQLRVPTEPSGPCGIDWVFEIRTSDGSYWGTFTDRPSGDQTRIRSMGSGLQPSC